MRLGKMSIDSLMSAADAAGYVMIAEDELPETFGPAPQVMEFKEQPTTSLAIWRPVVPAIDGQPVNGATYATAAWHWLAGRFIGGAPA
jgi:hypothetical protein